MHTTKVASPLTAPGTDEPSSAAPGDLGQQGFKARNLQLDFISRAPAGRQFSVVANYLDQTGAARVRALVVRGDTQALVRERGIHAARQGIVLDIIHRRASEPGLDPAGVAQQLGMSVRYLHRLLEPTGRTFSQHLVGQRLERALVALRKPDSRLKIADIAFACGFSDISHFNRSFRRAFGDTPYGVRVRAARARIASPRADSGVAEA